MNTFACVAVVLSLAAGPVLAESEGSGEPFTLVADARVVPGRPFVTDTWSEAQPVPTGNQNQAGTLEQLEPAQGSEAVVQTANSLPGRAGGAPSAFAGTLHARR
jgi:hypothetical protein